MIFNTLFRGFYETYNLNVEDVAEGLHVTTHVVYHYLSDTAPKSGLTNLLTYLKQVGPSDKAAFKLFMEDYVFKLISDSEKGQDLMNLDEVEIRHHLDQAFRWASANSKTINATSYLQEYSRLFGQEEYIQCHQKVNQFLEEHREELKPNDLYELKIIKGKTLSYMSCIERKMEYFQDAIKEMDQALEIFIKPKRAKIFEVERLKGSAYALLANWDDYVGNLKKALAHSEAALKYSDRKSSKLEAARALNNIINIYGMISYHENPKTNLEKAASFIPMALDKVDEDTPGQFLRILYSVIFRIYCESVSYGQPDKYYHLAYEFFNQCTRDDAVDTTSNYYAGMLSTFSRANYEYGILMNSDDHILGAIEYGKRCANLYKDEYAINKAITNIQLAMMHTALIHDQEADAMYDKTIEYLDRFHEEKQGDHPEYETSIKSCQLDAAINWLYHIDIDQAMDMNNQSKDRQEELKVCWQERLALSEDLLKDLGKTIHSKSDEYNQFRSETLVQILKASGDQEELEAIYDKLKAFVLTIDPGDYSEYVYYVADFLLIMDNLGKIIDENRPEYIQDRQVNDAAIKMHVSQNVAMAMTEKYATFFKNIKRIKAH